MSGRILIIDDSRTTLEVIKIHLMSLGCEFVTAVDAGEALLLARDKKPDLIISDLAMPGVTGIELCKKLKLTPVLQRIPFVVVTAKKEDAVRREAFAAGVDGFLRKPIDAERLKRLVTDLLSRQQSAAGPR